MLFLAKIGFLPVTFWDVLDVLIVGYLIYQIYKLLRGSIAFNIFIGVVLTYVVWWLVDALDMDLLALILGQFVSVGVIVLLIVFQPEVRRFLLFLGQGMMRRSDFWNRFLDKNLDLAHTETNNYVKEIKKAIKNLSATKTGALILFVPNTKTYDFVETGTLLDAHISSHLLESIFNKESPLHDGAVVIANNKIYAASCVLPISNNPNMPEGSGLRHRAALGVTEGTDVIAFIVSEETGKRSYAREGRLTLDINLEDIERQLKKLMAEFYQQPNP